MFSCPPASPSLFLYLPLCLFVVLLAIESELIVVAAAGIYYKFMANFDIVCLTLPHILPLSLTHTLSLSPSYILLSSLSLFMLWFPRLLFFFDCLRFAPAPVAICMQSELLSCCMWHVARCVLVLSAWAWHKHTFLNSYKKPHTQNANGQQQLEQTLLLPPPAVAVAAAPISCTIRSRRLVWGTT